MIRPMIPVSLGELVDKITILEIKLHKIHDANALKNIKYELSLLNQVYEEYGATDSTIENLKSQLADVNNRLWDIEDLIRIKDKKSEFDEEFIKLAKLVYQNNDVRAKIKREINIQCRSDLIEEKSYS